MRLRIVNEPKLFDKKIARKAVVYYIERLLGNRNEGISLTVVFKDDLGENHAYCMWMDDNHKPKKFKVVISSTMGRRKTLEILAHEMVHVKQYVTGQLMDYVYGSMVRWNGKKMLYDDNDVERYYDSPWEIEAYGRQLGLYVGFRKEYLGSDDF